MNSQQQGDHEPLTNTGALSHERRPEPLEPEMDEEGHTYLPPDETPEAPRMLEASQGNIAYELLLLQQRLAAYEQLHLEEMAELRREIESLRRAFLQETNPQLRAISPTRRQQVHETD